MKYLERGLRHSPLPARQLSGSVHVYIAHFLALLRHAVGVIDLNQSLHSTPLFGLLAICKSPNQTALLILLTFEMQPQK